MSITESFTQACTSSTGGIVSIWLSDRDNVSSFGLSGTEYNSVTMNSSSVFYKYDFEQDTGFFRFNGARENRSTTVDIELEFYINKMSTAARNAVQAIIDSSTCGIIAIVEDSNGAKWVAGYNESPVLGNRPLKLRSAEGTTGGAFTDDSGITPVLGVTHKDMPRVFTGTVPV